jgi:hypothetical protein
MANSRADEKSARFLRLAERRVTETIRKMRLIGNLANRHNYSYTDEHVKQILDALEAEFRQVKSRFQHGASAQSPGFSFKK